MKPNNYKQQLLKKTRSISTFFGGRINYLTKGLILKHEFLNLFDSMVK